MQKIIWAVALPSAFLLSGCLESDVQRAAVGAGVGAVAAEVTDNDPLVGAAVGAGIGALSDEIADAF
ncbi:YMGG-like glycine zipper-containing protein [Vannielia sp.]|uniref:YMGG-like glycine zipper-containing protein n=1 Tax=Vannielia sp. TaxID=2813045 RepID=UPI0026334D15|nr:YMGG-like glycine zipper-containing protein [Vannielia sp.]MDF1871440.1 YMGG-like glycine zipper-containing protein [Vannielia sp.]